MTQKDLRVRLEERLRDVMSRRRFVCPVADPKTYRPTLFEGNLLEHVEQYGWVEGLVIGFETRGSEESLLVIMNTQPLPKGSEVRVRTPSRGTHLLLARANADGTLEPQPLAFPLRASEVLNQKEGERLLKPGVNIYLQFPQPSSAH